MTLGNKRGKIQLDGVCTLPSLTSGQWIRNQRGPFSFDEELLISCQDNGEEITVHDARVYVPAKEGATHIAAWEQNTKYTYTFRITENSTGSTDPDYHNLDDPQVPANPTVYPIVFDGATIVEYESNVKEY